MQFVSRQNLTAEQQELLRLFSSLDQQGQQGLLDYAKFLLSKHGIQDAEETAQKLEPDLIERPEHESVVKAIKRLSKSYSMLDKSKLLDATSTLMTAHVLHGKPAAEVIDELELLFKNQYQIYLDED